MIKLRLMSGLAVAALFLLPGCPGTDLPGSEIAGPKAAEIVSLAITPDAITLNAPALLDSNLSISVPGPQPTFAGLASATHLTATATLHDGTTQKVGGVTWTSSNPSLIAVTPEGLAKALQPGVAGQVTVTASHKEKADLKAEAVITLVSDGAAAVEIE